MNEKKIQDLGQKMLALHEAFMIAGNVEFCTNAEYREADRKQNALIKRMETIVTEIDALTEGREWWFSTDTGIVTVQSVSK